MKFTLTYQFSTRSYKKVIILRSLFVLLVVIVAFDCWTNAQELAINSDMIEVVDNVEELESKKNTPSDLEKDDEVIPDFSFKSLHFFQSSGVSYNSFSLEFNYCRVPLLPPELSYYI